MDSVKTGRLIAQCRKEKGLTQKELAQGLHVTVQAVSKWERGRNFPDIALLEPLAQRLGLTVSQLLGGSRQEPSGEALVRESLHTFGAVWHRRLRRWRWLFALTAALLVSVLLAAGWWWVSENTDWLPQRHTLVEPLDVVGLEDMVAQAGGREVLLYQVVLADRTKRCSFQLELWTPQGLVRTHACGGLDWSGGSIAPPRREPLVISYQRAMEQPETTIEFGISFCGVTWRGALEQVPNRGGGMMTQRMDRSTAVPSGEDGAVLACLVLDDGAGYVRPGQTGVAVQPEPEPGQVWVLLRICWE